MTQGEFLVWIDPILCEGTGFCVQISPKVFHLVEGSPARVIATPLTDQDLTDAKEAAVACPTRAIGVTEFND